MSGTLETSRKILVSIPFFILVTKGTTGTLAIRITQDSLLWSRKPAKAFVRASAFNPYNISRS